MLVVQRVWLCLLDFGGVETGISGVVEVLLFVVVCHGARFEIERGVLGRLMRRELGL